MLRVLFYPMIIVLSSLVAFIPYYLINPVGWDLISWQVTYWPAIFLLDILVSLIFEYRLAQSHPFSNTKAIDRMSVMDNLGKAFLVMDSLIFVYFTMNTLLKVQLETISPMIAIYHLCGVMFAYVTLMILMIRKKYV